MLHPTRESSGFELKNFEAFGQALGYRPWPYSPEGTYWNGKSRFLDWEKREPLVGLAHSELLFSEYDPAQGRNYLYAFLRPKAVAEALEAVASIGWADETAALLLPRS